MRPLTPRLYLAAAVLAGFLVGCSSAPKTPDVAGTVRTSLDQAGLKNVSVTQDRVNGVVTLGGHVGFDAEKAQAESIARSIAGNQVVADQIAVVPPGAERDARSVNSDLDSGIEHNLDAALIAQKLHDGIKYAVKNQVVTLSGDVDSPAKRAQAQAVAASVPYVQQVVNELQVRGQRASSSR